MFFVLVYDIFVKYIANVAQRTFEIVQKSRSANNNITRNTTALKLVDPATQGRARARAIGL